VRTLDSTLVTYLNATNVSAPGRLFTITLADATVLRYTDLDIDVVYGGNTWLSGGEISVSAPLANEGGTSQTLDLAVDAVDLELKVNETVLRGSIPYAQAAAQGLFRGARVLIERVFMNTATGLPYVPCHWFEGRIAEAKVGGTEIQLTVKSELEGLNIKIPHQVYQPACTRALFDAGCGLTKASFTYSTTVWTQCFQPIYTRALPSGQPYSVSGYFDLGMLTITSGAYAGISRPITQHVYDNTAGINEHRFYLSPVLPGTPAYPGYITAGTTFTVIPGCDKKMATCNTKFSNLTRFRGMPFVPRPETVR
jgi:uncharacterized phage protein (TIGR02218 family)